MKSQLGVSGEGRGGVERGREEEGCKENAVGTLHTSFTAAT